MMNLTKSIKLCLIISIIGISLTSIMAQATVSLKMDNYTITTNQNVTFDFVGLNQSQMYIMVITNTQTLIPNVTFTSSGYEHKIFNVFIPNDNDSSLTVDLYQYSSSTAQNSSVSLFSVTITEIKPTDYNNVDYIIQNLLFVFPIIAIAIFASYLFKTFRKNIQ